MKKKYLILLIIAVVIGITIIAYQWRIAHLTADAGSEPLSDEIVEEIPEVVINYLYGLPIDSFTMERGKVKRNQPLSSLLSDYGVTNKQIFDIDQKAKGIFDPKRFRSGNPYTAFLEADSANALAFLVYEHSATDYVVFRFRDSLDVWNGVKDIDTIRQTFAGTIESSLWNALTDHQANPMLAIRFLRFTPGRLISSDFRRVIVSGWYMMNFMSIVCPMASERLKAHISDIWAGISGPSLLCRTVPRIILMSRGIVYEKHFSKRH